MELWILNKNLEQVGVVDDYKSLIWSKRYIELGDCEVYISANERTLDLFKKGYYILRTDDDMICRIEKVEIDTDVEVGNFLVVTGYDCRKMLNQRIVWNQITLNGTVSDFVRKVMYDNVVYPSDTKRKMQHFELGNIDGFNDVLDIQSRFDYVFDKIKEICTTYSYGSRLKFENGFFIFDLYKGVDRSIKQTENDVVMFSHEFENLIATKYSSDSSGYKSAALVGGEGEGVERVVEEVDGGVGVNRFELFVDANDVSSEISYEDLIAKYPNGTQVVEDYIVYYVVDNIKIAILNHVDNPTTAKLIGDTYKVLLHQKGVESLADVKELITFEGSVEPNYSYKYGEDYFLGDIVTVSNEYGITANARITEVIESHDDNGYSIIPTFEYVVTEDYLLTEDEQNIINELGESLLTEN